MSIDAINVLEQKIDLLIETIRTVREENANLNEKVREKEGEIEVLTEEKQNLASKIDRLKGDTEDHQNKLNTATEKIQGLIAKLEAVS